MATNRLLACVAIGAAVVLSAAGASAQSSETFKGRLSALPVDPVTVRTTTGSGTVTAVLQGTKLTVSGKFEGMNSPATAAHVHLAARGLRGPNVFDLTVAKAASGSIEGTITLTPAQVDRLKSGYYYVQIHTEKNPEGQLRGWLLK